MIQPREWVKDQFGAEQRGNKQRRHQTVLFQKLETKVQVISAAKESFGYGFAE